MMGHPHWCTECVVPSHKNHKPWGWKGAEVIFNLPAKRRKKTLNDSPLFRWEEPGLRGRGPYLG